MLKTIADLVNKAQIKHDLSKEDRMLNLPLSRFNPIYYADILTIVWLMTLGWIDRSKLPNSQLILGEISKIEVDEFYSAIRREMEQVILPKAKPTKKNPLQIAATANSNWLTPAQVTLGLQYMTLFKVLMDTTDYDRIFSILLQWFNTSKMDVADELYLLESVENQEQKGTKRFHMHSLVSDLVKLELFKSNPSPQNFAYECIAKLSNETKNQGRKLSHEASAYFLEVYLNIAKFFLNKNQFVRFVAKNDNNADRPASKASGFDLSSFKAQYVVDYLAIAEFMKRHPDLKTNTFTKEHEDLFSLMADEETANQIIAKLAQINKLIELDDIPTLNKKLTCIEQTLKQLDQASLLPFNSNPIFFKEKISSQWLQIQKKIAFGFKQIVETQLVDENEKLCEGLELIANESSNYFY